VENAIKHNRASDKQPLQIRILSEDNAYISVVNNLNPKTTSYSTGVGLENLVMRYKLLTRKELVISQDDRLFKVSLPLLNQEELQLETYNDE
jgi:LytS/YehU family sensor histidine kinase